MVKSKLTATGIFEYKENAASKKEEDYIDELRELIKDAVNVRLDLRGSAGRFSFRRRRFQRDRGKHGADFRQPVKTFSIGFNEDSFNELKYARLTAEHFSTEHHEFIVTPDLFDIVDELVWHFDEPFADSSALPTYMVSKMAREYVTVVLSGDGGDELFGGYTRYVTDKKRAGLANLPKSIRTGLLQPVSQMLPHNAPGKNYLYNVSLDAIDRYIDNISHLTARHKKALYSAGLRQNMNGTANAGEELFRQFASGTRTGNPIDKLLYLDSKTYLPGDILTKVDRMSMAASLEARVPLLDHKLIEFVTGIPAELKLKGLETKYIFKRAMQGVVA